MISRFFSLGNHSCSEVFQILKPILIETEILRIMPLGPGGINFSKFYENFDELKGKESTVKENDINYFGSDFSCRTLTDLPTSYTRSIHCRGCQDNLVKIQKLIFHIWCEIWYWLETNVHIFSPQVPQLDQCLQRSPPTTSTVHRSWLIVLATSRIQDLSVSIDTVVELFWETHLMQKLVRNTLCKL